MKEDLIKRLEARLRLIKARGKHIDQPGVVRKLERKINKLKN